VLSAISDLSEKINTGRGVLAKISGGVERAKASANLSDDVSEYQALVVGFVPLVARGVGHVGVLTQQDVDSVRQLFPAPGDSKSVRDRKIANLETIIAAVGQATEKAYRGASPLQPPSKNATESPTNEVEEWERSPDGKLRRKP
jgi:hypothetical protein